MMRIKKFRKDMKLYKTMTKKCEVICFCFFFRLGREFIFYLLI